MNDNPELQKYKKALYQLANNAQAVVSQTSNSRPEERYYFVLETYIHSLEALLERLAREFPEEVSGEESEE